MPLLENRVAVVTGAARAIGQAIARTFVGDGARVLRADIDEQAVDALVALAVSTFGRLDVMVNNAGITRDATLRPMTEEQVDAVIGVHLTECRNSTRAFLASDLSSYRTGTVAEVTGGRFR